MCTQPYFWTSFPRVFFSRDNLSNQSGCSHPANTPAEDTFLQSGSVVFTCLRWYWVSEAVRSWGLLKKNPDLIRMNTPLSSVLLYLWAPRCWELWSKTHFTWKRRRNRKWLVLLFNSTKQYHQSEWLRAPLFQCLPAFLKKTLTFLFVHVFLQSPPQSAYSCLSVVNYSLNPIRAVNMFFREF